MVESGINPTAIWIKEVFQIKNDKFKGFKKKYQVKRQQASDQR